ncbi:hypothetical protein PYW08_010883 [Mythimna loreyi]|uniref:Uncharacterized protein n=1 Tax=Mythimna loreyi TaxID=667449 RepID=A0ACC2Q468_9NEOP|nr:hypothetical protein PYW08_010883 [Mythimna loreyi]
MNCITFVFGYILIFLMVYVSSSKYIILSETKQPVSVPFNFSFKRYQVLLMSITLKNVPPSVTTVYFIYTTKQAFYVKHPIVPVEKIKIDAEIKNGEVQIMFVRSLGEDYNVLVDVELDNADGTCNTSRIAEGRYDDTSHYYHTKGKNVFWHTNWHYNDQLSCIAPNLCEIVVDFYNRCAENFLCYYNATQYICTLSNESQKFKHFKLYQTYDDDVPRAKWPLREDYTCIEAVESCYKVHTTPKSWYDAQRACTQEGTSLFYPENSDEVTAVLAFWKSTSALLYMYVGISDIAKEGHFQTIDGKSITEVYNEWNYHQPDNYRNEDCVHINQKGKYNDIPCNNPYSFICKKSLLSPERNVQHNSSSLIGDAWDTSAMNTKLIIELESFDNNTSLNVVPLKFFGKYKLWSKKIILSAKDLVKDNAVTTLHYSETMEVTFNCQEYISQSKYRQTFIGLITKENKIKTFNETQIIQRKFNMSHNGSILCCLYYDYTSTNQGKDLQITRFLVNRTLLMFQHLNPGGNETQSSLIAKSYNYSWVIYVSATLIGLSVLTLALYFIIKQGCFKKSQPVSETVEMDNQMDQNEVVYANLEFVNIANQPHRTQNEESHYADIIGVLHPH